MDKENMSLINIEDQGQIQTHNWY